MKIYKVIPLLVLVLCVAAFAQQKERRRGKYLRTEIRKTETKDAFAMKLAESKGSFMKLEFRKLKILTHHEVRLYEVLLEIVKENPGDGITPRGAVDYILVPNETYDGEESTRVEKVDNGPLANCNLSLNGMPVMTDKDGVYLDASQDILGQFDNMRVNSLPLVAKHKDYGKLELELVRRFIKREDAELPGVKKQETADLMEAFGQDYTQQRISSADGLSVKVAVPDKAMPGQVVAITVEVSNEGEKPISNLLGRTFSNESSINGKLFYFGCVQPGKKLAFSRLVKMPEKQKATYFATVAFWNILGAVPAKAYNFRIDVE